MTKYLFSFFVDYYVLKADMNIERRPPNPLNDGDSGGLLYSLIL